MLVTRNIEENIDWLLEDPVPSLDMASCESPLKTEVKCEAGCEEQLHDGTGLQVGSMVKEDVQVKVEQEDKANVSQGLCLSSPGGCGACVLSCDRAEASSEVECDRFEIKQYLCKRDSKGNWHRM